MQTGRAAPHQSERAEERLPGSVTGRVVLTNLQESRDVTLRDISRNGAKLVTGDWPDLPKNFYLMLRAPGAAEPLRIECERRWQVGPTTGVRFTAPIADDLLASLAMPQQPPEN